MPSPAIQLKRIWRLYIKPWSIALLLAIIIILLLRTFIGETFLVTGTSMENTLRKGDLVIANKLAYGPRIPMTPLGIPLTDIYSKGTILSYRRLSGYSSIDRNDLLVFNYPPISGIKPDRKTPFVKRCIGLPGDSVLIKDGDVYVNGQQIEMKDGVKQRYWLQLDSTADGSLIEDLGKRYTGMQGPHGILMLYLTVKEADTLKTLAGITSLQEMITTPGLSEEGLFPLAINNAWTIDYFGPVCVPYKGQVVQLSHSNLAFYQRIIQEYEGHELEIGDGMVLIDGFEVDEYVVQMDYYFVLGDNRDDSSDSRQWGFVPEDHIIGKASMVLYNRNGGRWFHGIH